MAIEQHPIPQDVAGYKFRLIGEMTIKQFAFLAAGIILGLIFYSLPLPFFFKYPLAAVAVGLGAGIAFLPVEGRSMDKWLIAFIKSIYSPTEYVWQKQEGGEVIVAQKVAAPVVPTPVTPTPTPAPAAPSPTLQPAVTAPAVGGTHAPTPTEEKIPTPEPVVITPPVPQPVAPTPVTPSTPAPRSAQRVEPSVAGAKEAVPSAALPIPFTPSAPNTLVGMTLTPEGKILDGALIEIKSKGVSQRATKSNQLGQFLFAKPLENGLYQIATEKAGYLFDTYSIDLRGLIVKPLKLQAKTHV